MGITYKEFVWLIKPEDVGEEFWGGVRNCPEDYGISDKRLFSNCAKAGSEECKACWNREIPYPVIAEAVKDGEVPASQIRFKKGAKFKIRQVDASSLTALNVEVDILGIPVWMEKEDFRFHIEKGEEKMSRYKVGDKVIVREWEDMEKEFGLDSNGDIKCELLFLSGMKKYCGKELTISRQTMDGLYRTAECGYSFSDDMLLPTTFYKEDMKDGFVIKTRNGKRFVVSGERLLSENGFLNLEQYTSGLCHTRYRDFDIVAVENPNKSPGNLNDLLNGGSVIWVRRKTVKELSAREAENMLKEKFPEYDELHIKVGD